MTGQIKRPDYYRKPVFLFAVALVTIFIIELLVMFFLYFLSGLPLAGEAFLDAFLLSLFAVPFFYYLLFKPLRANIKDRISTELEHKKTAEMSRMKSEFISIAAHELNTPLASIMGYSELLLMKGEYDEEFVTIINQKANVIERLIDDLLDVGLRERSQSLRIQKETADIIPVIESVLKNSKEKYPLRHIGVQLPETKIQVPFDRMRIEQVLDNLLSNADKFSSPESPVEIIVTLQDKCFLVRVCDQGIGMSPEESGQAFDKFYRASFSNTSPAGLGLGMTIVKEIIISHGGEVQIESRPEAGTTVSFTLPID